MTPKAETPTPRTDVIASSYGLSIRCREAVGAIERELAEARARADRLQQWCEEKDALYLSQGKQLAEARAEIEELHSKLQSLEVYIVPDYEKQIAELGAQLAAAEAKLHTIAPEWFDESTAAALGAEQKDE